ncbi:MAG: hypothetical protein ACOH5I_08275 [Oligoflexus sp.]
MKSLVFAIGGVIISGVAQAQAWNFTPQIYARGGYTLSSDFAHRGSNSSGDLESKWNFGPWQSESNMFASPLTELTLEATYGEDFRFFYGVDVENNNRFSDGNRKAVNERLAYLEYLRGGMSLWFGSRPYRSDAEYLTRSYSFDEKNLFGGGVRFEHVGPLNVEFAYGSKERETGSADVSEMVNILINKLEYPLANGVIRTNLEVQQLKRRSYQNPDQDDNTHSYMAGIGYKRWGDRIFNGNLYNQFLVHYSTGFVVEHFMSSVFAAAYEGERYNDDFDAEKLLLQWNGDWKAERFGLYWANFYQAHTGKDPQGSIADGEMKWTTLDSFIRPQYGILDNVTVGAEYARRNILDEGDGVPNWAQNQGGWRWAGMINYHLENLYFDNPVVSLFIGEVHHDQAKVFFNGRHAENNSHFIRLNYEININ